MWPSFFKDILSTTGIPYQAAIEYPDELKSAESISGKYANMNKYATDFTLKVMLSIDEEMVNPIFIRGKKDHERNTMVKDEMREESVILLAQWWYNIIIFVKIEPKLVEQSLHLISVYIFNVIGVELTTILLEDGDTFSLNFVKAYQILESLLPIVLKFLESDDNDVSTAVYGLLTEFLTLFKKIYKKGEKVTISQAEFLFELLQASIKKMTYDENYCLPETSDVSVENYAASLDEDDEDAVFLNNRQQLKQYIDSISILIPDQFKSYVLGLISETFLHAKNYGFVNPINKISSSAAQPGLNWPQAEIALYLMQIYMEQCSSKGALNFIHEDLSSQKMNQLSDNQNQYKLTEFSELILLMINSKIINCTNPLVSLLFFETCVRTTPLFNYCPEAIPLVLEPFLGPQGIYSQHRYVKTRMWYFLLRFIKLTSIKKLAPYSLEIIKQIAPLLEIHVQTFNRNYQTSAGITGYGTFDSQVYLFEACGIIISLSPMSDEDRMTCFTKILDPIFSAIQPILALPLSSLNSQSSQLLLVHHYLVAIGAIAQGFPDAKISFPNMNTSSSQMTNTISPISAEALKKAANLNILILETFNSFAIIREGVRVSFSRILSALGHDALNYLPRLITGLVSVCEIDEFSDLLGFLGLVMFRFKSYIAETANELLLPIVNKVYMALNSGPVSGTDEALLLVDLKKTYLTWLGAIFNADLDSIFLSPTNTIHIQNIMRTLITLALDFNNPPVQKLAFGVIHRSIIGWLIDTQGDYNLGTISLMALGSQSSGFTAKSETNSASKKAIGVKPSSFPLDNQIEQLSKERTMRQIAAESIGVIYNSRPINEFRAEYVSFLQQEVLPLCFQTPSSNQFNLNDAQCSQIVTEICGVLRGFVLAGQSDAGRILLPKARISPLISVPAGQNITIEYEREAISQNKMTTFLFYDFLQKMGCNEYSAFNFVKSLLFLGSRDFKRFFMEFIAQAKA
ncbi:hypothetical protein BB561_006654 [Smittium simulii]|uniref:Exportin-T n=1 Tax=Smittium simulii TaxID=133385 RepID=A0A2T9Y2Q9_9FUNG|nr:hypothetical protein BB561_006654 [Smittium simulii]